MRTLVLVLLLILCFPRTTMAAGPAGEETFANLVTAANACLRDDMTQIPSDGYLIDYWECLSTTGLISQILAWYGDSYPTQLPPDLSAAASLTQAAEESTRALLRSDDSLWRPDVLTLLDLSDAYLADFRDQPLAGDGGDVIFAAMLSLTTECLDAMAGVVQTSAGPQPGAEWLFGRCLPITDMVGARLVDPSLLSSLPVELVIAAEQTRVATTLTYSRISPEWSTDVAAEVLLLSEQAKGNIAAWEEWKCQENPGNEQRCPRRDTESLP